MKMLNHTFFIVLYTNIWYIFFLLSLTFHSPSKVLTYEKWILCKGDNFTQSNFLSLN